MGKKGSSKRKVAIKDPLGIQAPAPGKKSGKKKTKESVKTLDPEECMGSMIGESAAEACGLSGEIDEGAVCLSSDADLDALIAQMTRDSSQKKKARQQEREKEAAKAKAQEGESFFQEGSGRKYTEEGYRIMSETELGINKKDAGQTDDCPFDCQCCF
ncbi:protein of unknown function DUF1764, eukaryotic [Kipferlia bialata]|uniref:DUF1764 domain-containing protein n=1 Tax=Kipferlia bialata TaxID=797122 RepID=A0A9K3GH12_9EUKA|nr:protein of unknown function DUF1764, eukaryotic [Kipferlia bialata]|eukprot:g3210.t1